ncbi:hypothetical protein [Enterobacter bugandensis]|uniref:hypothetical protein n=1 Tax=Enterobacter bugandensis TaxID=881260 RepID=UPI003B5AE649
MALLIGCVRFLSTWSHDLPSIPANVQWFVARQLGISEHAFFLNIPEEKPRCASIRH